MIILWWGPNKGMSLSKSDAKMERACFLAEFGFVYCCIQVYALADANALTWRLFQAPDRAMRSPRQCDANTSINRGLLATEIGS